MKEAKNYVVYTPSVNPTRSTLLMRFSVFSQIHLHEFKAK